MMETQSTLKQPDVHNAMSELVGERDRLAERVGTLTERLECVLAASESPKAERERQAGSCSVSDAVYSEADSIRGIADRIDDILHRLEI